jgi:hypothetical protein
MAANYPAAADFGHVYGQMGQGGTSGFFAAGGKRNSPYQLCRPVLPKAFFFPLCKPKSFRHTIAQCIPGKIVPAAFPANRLCGCRHQIGTNVCHKTSLMTTAYIIYGYFIENQDIFTKKFVDLRQDPALNTTEPNLRGNRTQCSTKLKNNFVRAMFVPN